MKPVETVKVTNKKVSCDGGEGSLGHPKVYLEIGSKGQIECPYCGKTFILNKVA